MEFNFKNEPLGNAYPLYNDSYLIFSVLGFSENPSYCEITIPQFDTPFIIFPDAFNNFRFNFKEIVKSLVSSNFEDNFRLFPDIIEVVPKNRRVINLECNIKVYFPGNQEIEIDKTYDFLRSVKQQNEIYFAENTYTALNPSFKSDNTHYLTYNDNYPLFFELFEVQENDTVILILDNNQFIQETVNDSGILRININRINELDSTENPPIKKGRNQINILVNGTLIFTLIVDKLDTCIAPHLKWFNDQGGYSHFTFEPYFRETLRSRNLGNIQRYTFENVDDNPDYSDINIGKTGERQLRIKSTVNDSQLYLLQEIITSPSVQLYDQETFTYINLNNITGNIVRNTKKQHNTVTLTLQLPQVNTITY